jgi:hypothetical protein
LKSTKSGSSSFWERNLLEKSAWLVFGFGLPLDGALVLDLCRYDRLTRSRLFCTWLSLADLAIARDDLPLNALQTGLRSRFRSAGWSVAASGRSSRDSALHGLPSAILSPFSLSSPAIRPVPAAPDSLSAFCGALDRAD